VLIPKVLALAFTLTVIVGCASETSTSTDDSLFPEDSGATSGTFTDDAGNTMQFGPGTTLPESWPEVLPIPDGELLSVSMSQDGGALATWMIPDDRAQQILDDYLAALVNNGFTQPTLSGMSVPDEGVYSYDTSGNGFDVTVSAVVADVESELTVIATAQSADGA
jgi:hypothetical protein